MNSVFLQKKINECFSPRDESYEAFECFKILIQNAATASHLVKLKSNLAAKESVTFFSKNFNFQLLRRSESLLEAQN